MSKHKSFSNTRGVYIVRSIRKISPDGEPSFVAMQYIARCNKAIPESHYQFHNQLLKK